MVEHLDDARKNCGSFKIAAYRTALKIAGVHIREQNERIAMNVFLRRTSQRRRFPEEKPSMGDDLSKD